MNKLTIGSLLLLFSTAFAIPKAIAQTPTEPDNTRVEKYEDLTQPESPADASQSEMDSMEMKQDQMKQGQMNQGEGMGMEKPQGAEPPETRTQETLDEAQSGDMQPGNMQPSNMQSGGMMMGSDVRRTEAFNLVSSAYRGDFEKQGIDGYQVLISDYETGKVTADDIIKAGIDSGELSPKAMEDDSYVSAVDSQLMSLTNR